MSIPNGGCMDQVKIDEDIEKKKKQTNSQITLSHKNSKLLLIKVLIIIEIIK